MTATPHGSFASLTAADGHVLDCWIEPARGTVRGGLVVLQEIFGVTDQLKGVAARYAAQGFKVAVPALFDRQQKGTVIPFDEARRGLDLMQATDPEAVMLDLSAAAEAVRDAGKVGVIGFCWGGGLALRAAQTSGVAAAVSFYGTRLEHLLDRPLKAALQCHFGTRDSHTPPEVVDRLRAHAPQAEIHMYDVGHAFANDHRPAAFDAQATTLAHERTAAFLARNLG